MDSAQKNNPAMTQLMVLFTLVVSGVLVLNEKQTEGIVQILLSAANPAILPATEVAAPGTASSSQPDIIAGYAALSSFLGYSIPTCVRMSKEGRFDAAVLDYGGATRKKMWDRTKLIEIARKKK